MWWCIWILVSLLLRVLLMLRVVGIVSIGLLILGALLIVLARRIWLTAITSGILLRGPTDRNVSIPVLV